MKGKLTNMKVVALVSGGKDSCFNMMQCIAHGHEIVALAHLKPSQDREMDSYMYQSVGHNAIELYAEAMDLPLFQQTINGSALCQTYEYARSAGDEVEDLYELLKKIKSQIDFQGVSSGAIFSNYQRIRVEDVCSRLNATSLAYLWEREQVALLQEMIDSQLHAILIKVATLGLDPRKHLGKSLQKMQPHLLAMKDKYQINVCGEGGEYETLTLDCPLFVKKLVIEESELVMHSDDPIAPVGYLKFKKISLEKKEIDSTLTLTKRLQLSSFNLFQKNKLA